MSRNHKSWVLFCRTRFSQTNQHSIMDGGCRTWSYLGVQKRQLVGIDSVQAERRAIVRPLFVWSQRQSRLNGLLSSSRHVWGEPNHLCAQQRNTRLARVGRSRYSSPELALRSFHIVRIMHSLLEPWRFFTKPSNRAAFGHACHTKK